ncbi:hypothetical protein QJS66_23540 (plasmid) [Kocuria rhizophila]|nr:hypothetical protein QJS66_23540 [Kocuria rhizophila]
MASPEAAYRRGAHHASPRRRPSLERRTFPRSRKLQQEGPRRRSRRGRRRCRSGRPGAGTSRRADRGRPHRGGHRPGCLHSPGRAGAAGCSYPWVQHGEVLDGPRKIPTDIVRMDSGRELGVYFNRRWTPPRTPPLTSTSSCRARRPATSATTPSRDRRPERRRSGKP